MSVEITCICDLKSEVGEGAFWDGEERALYFNDIAAGTLYRLKEGHLDRWEFGEPLGCMALDGAGKVVVALKSGIYRFDAATGAKTLIANPEADRPGNRFNIPNPNLEPESVNTVDFGLKYLDPSFAVTPSISSHPSYLSILAAIRQYNDQTSDLLGD